jgi:phosphatidylinositol 4-kinase
LDTAPLDVKGLLQTYLSEFDDEASFGHMSLGRSFALEMGSVIPSTDQRLGAIERQGININTASDFITQYTTRQEYKFLDGVNDQEEEWLRNGATSRPRPSYLSRSLQDATNLLVDLENRTLNHKHVTIAELRDILRRAAALLCRAKTEQAPIVHHFQAVHQAWYLPMDQRHERESSHGVTHPGRHCRKLGDYCTQASRYLQSFFEVSISFYT